ncbi:MAG: hypothetical protein HYV63_26095 [Candidatus Schekmanbacteria bacterium]|nr:hypothetical protein [Candidatus Schekmanbacteria bacterium]
MLPGSVLAADHLPQLALDKQLPRTDRLHEMDLLLDVRREKGQVQKLRDPHARHAERPRRGWLLRVLAAVERRLDQVGEHEHLPIRQVLLLAVNVLLADATLPNPVLNCNRARRRASESRYEATNPYGNVFGGNLNERERAQHLVFAALMDLGVGRETESEVDDLLVFGEYEAPERFRRLVQEDERFGDATYAWERKGYLHGERRQVSWFLRALEAQRRRLFFEAPDGPQDRDRVSRWRLTAFRHAGEDLEFRKSPGNCGPCRGPIPRHSARRF